MGRIACVCRIALLLSLVSGWAAVAQMYPYPGRSTYPRGTGRTPNNGQQQQAGDPLPSFDGTVRGIDSKLLTLERPDSNTIEFNCSKKTKYYDGSDKKIKPSAIKAGDRVLVEAKRALDGTLDAVNVRLNRQKSS